MGYFLNMGGGAVDWWLRDGIYIGEGGPSVSCSPLHSKKSVLGNPFLGYDLVDPFL